MEKQWCLNVHRKLRDANRYLQTDFRVHCQPHNSNCADHCQQFALNNPVEANFQQPCSHERIPFFFTQRNYELSVADTLR